MIPYKDIILDQCVFKWGGLYVKKKNDFFWKKEILN